MPRRRLEASTISCNYCRWNRHGYDTPGQVLMLTIALSLMRAMFCRLRGFPSASRAACVRVSQGFSGPTCSDVEAPHCPYVRQASWRCKCRASIACYALNLKTADGDVADLEATIDALHVQDSCLAPSTHGHGTQQHVHVPIRYTFPGASSRASLPHPSSLAR